jgi:hypothetical protein
VSWEIGGEAKSYEACAIGKAKRKNIMKKSNNQISENVGLQIFINLCCVKKPEYLVTDL